MKIHKSNLEFSTRKSDTERPANNMFRFLLIITAVLFLSFGFDIDRQQAKKFPAVQKGSVEQTAAMPKLEGDKAKEYLEKKGLFDSLGEAIAKARYKVREVEQKTTNEKDIQFEAGNPRNEYHASFKADGTMQLNGGAGTNRWESSFKLLKYGRGENLKDVTSSRWRAAESRAENQRDSIIEWFENKPSGLEHGFTITEKPQASAEMRALRVTMKIGGNLRPRLDENGQSLALGNQVLRYSKLKVLDAGGAELPARMSLQGEELTIEADDANAVYPVTIDPVFEPLKKLTASDGAAGDQFGWSVSISGDTAIVGAYGDDNSKGAAYIFERNQGGANNWGEVKKLTPSVAAFDSFGWSVSISGDTAVVGEFAVFDGKVYVFERNTGGANNWGEAKIINDPEDTADHFGMLVSISGDTVIVGTWNFGGQYGTWEEKVYIFERNKDGANNWGLVKTLTASDSSILVFEYFGWSVSISGDTAIVGSYADNNGKGAAYIFERNAGGADNWGEVKKITASDGAAGDNFGVSVSISGDVAVIGAFGNDSSKGAAYIFERNNGGMNNWSEVKKLTASDGAANDGFGGSVSISVDTAIVAGLSSAYIFERNTGGADNWGQVKKLTGGSVSISGDTAIVGASGDDGGKGAAYVFGTPVTCPGITISPSLLPDATVGSAYNQTVSASGGSEPYTFEVTGGALPDGLILNANTGAISGTPSVAGVFSFTVTATADGGCTGSQAYTILVTGNTAPTAAADFYVTNEDTLLNIPAPGVLGNDSDADGNPLTAVLVGAPSNAGSFSLNSDGSFSYSPAANFNGTDSFTYKARDDSSADSLPVMVSITVNPVNDPPGFASGGNVSSPANTPYNSAWATNISSGAPNESGQTVTFIVTANTNPALFSAGPIISPNGDLSFTPAPNASGFTQLTVVLKDNGGTANNGHDTSAPVTFSITIIPVNAPPTVAVIPEGACSPNVTGVLKLNIADPDTPIENLSLSAETSNALLVPSIQILFGSNRQFPVVLITARPLWSVQSALVTITVRDREGGMSQTTIRVTVGTEAANTINGTSGVDMIFGLGGNDTLNGAGGIDLLCGGDGSDTLNGGANGDSLFGEEGDDYLFGDAGNDYLFGGAGNDQMRGGDGTDALTGGTGADWFISGGGSDSALDYNSGEGDLLLYGGFLTPPYSFPR